MRGPIEVAPGVHALGDDVVNLYAIVDGGQVTLVDAGLAGFGDRVEADLGQLGHTLRDVAAVVLTHGDGDHTGMAPRLQAAGARVLIHERDEEILVKADPSRGERSPLKVVRNLWRPAVLRIMAHMVRNGGTKSPSVEGAETFAADAVLDVPGRPRVLHTPGHTAGHCAFLLEDRGVLFAGDALCTHPWMTGGGEGIRTMPAFLNEDDATARASLDVIAGVGAGVILVGHGDPWRHGTAEAVRRAKAA
jgi:glyoxylase-like metal-dependent hydrolase (beta-lactamase superfamily II)